LYETVSEIKVRLFCAALFIGSDVMLTLELCVQFSSKQNNLILTVECSV